MEEMINMPDEMVLARMMTGLDLEFEKAMHYHDEGYKGDNDCGLPSQVMGPVHIYSIITIEASFDLAQYAVTKCQMCPFTLRCSRGLPYS